MNTRKGFTLVELLVVIAILAILATVSVVGYTSFINNANNSVALSELTQIRDYYIANKYIDENTTIEELDTKLALGGEIAAVAGSANWYSYTLEDGGVAYWNVVTNEVTTTAPAADQTPSQGGNNAGTGEGTGE